MVLNSKVTINNSKIAQCDASNSQTFGYGQSGMP